MDTCPTCSSLIAIHGGQSEGDPLYYVPQQDADLRSDLAYVKGRFTKLLERYHRFIKSEAPALAVGELLVEWLDNDPRFGVEVAGLGDDGRAELARHLAEVIAPVFEPAKQPTP